MNSRLRIGIAGFGVVAGQVHVPLLKTFPEVELVAIAEADASLLSAGLSAVPTARGFCDYRQMLEQVELDAVFVCLPTPLHAQAALDVLSRGTALYLEKPLGCCLDEGRRVLEAWKACNPPPTTMVGFNFRRAPVFAELKQQLREERLGSILHIHSVNSRHSMVVPGWKEKRANGGGVLLDLASHHFDLWEHLSGQEVSSIKAESLSRVTEQDTATVQALMSGGVTCSGFFCFNSSEEDRIVVYGEKGRLSVERMSELRVSFRPASSRLIRLKKLLEQAKGLLTVPRLLERYRSPWSCSSYRRSLKVFLQGVSQKRSVKPDLADGFRALELVVAAERGDDSGLHRGVGI